MTIKEKKNWLEQYKFLGMQVDYNIHKCKIWRERAESITAVYSNTTKTNGFGSKIENAIIKILEHENIIGEQSNELIVLEQMITKAINSISDPLQRQILSSYYLQNLTYEEIAEQMHYSSKWIRKRLNDALDILQIPQKNDYESLVYS